MSEEYNLLYIIITIIPQAHTKNEKIDINKLSTSGIIVLIKSAPKYIQIFPKFFYKNKQNVSMYKNTFGLNHCNTHFGIMAQ